MLNRSKGENLTRTEVQKIKENHLISPHCQERMKERNFKGDFKEVCDNYHMAFYMLDYSIALYVNEDMYFIVKYSKKQKTYRVVTFCNNTGIDHIKPERKQFMKWLGMKRTSYKGKKKQIIKKIKEGK